MKKPDFPTPYTTYSYLTRTDIEGDVPTYAVHVLLWMPENYNYVGWDNEKPVEPDTKATYYRIKLEDDLSEKEDSTEYKPVAITINMGPPEDNDKERFVESYYVVTNEKPDNVKIKKKPKAKVAYIHADNGGASPQPPTDSLEILGNI